MIIVVIIVMLMVITMMLMMMLLLMMMMLTMMMLLIMTCYVNVDDHCCYHCFAYDDVDDNDVDDDDADDDLAGLNYIQKKLEANSRKTVPACHLAWIRNNRLAMCKCEICKRAKNNYLLEHSIQQIQT